ncbi:hypothetical protein [Metabacillus sp. FJAT-52054]|uniref:Uncharacterized protein n=1 Tax=Metabacillus sediminis TaxID=3117746 RepID=A0ABZ2NHI8_9BACI
MNSNLPALDKMTTLEAIHWYTGEVMKVTSREARINGTYPEEYLDSLYKWKMKLNRRCEAERRNRGKEYVNAI